MKKKNLLFLACTLMLGGCSSKEEAQKYVCTLEDENYKTTIVLEGEGDKAYKQISNYVSSSQDKDAQAQVDELSSYYENMSGIEYSAKITDTEIIETLIYDYTTNLNQMVEEGFSEGLIIDKNVSLDRLIGLYSYQGLDCVKE